MPRSKGPKRVNVQEICPGDLIQTYVPGVWLVVSVTLRPTEPPFIPFMYVLSGSGCMLLPVSFTCRVIHK